MSITYYEVSADEIVEKLKGVLKGLQEVTVAVLFGSVTRRRFVRDVDVGVYLSSSCELKDLIRLAHMLEDALRLPVDLVPLRSLQPKLRLKALLNGVKLVVREKRLFEFMLREALSEAVDVDLKLRETAAQGINSAQLNYRHECHFEPFGSDDSIEENIKRLWLKVFAERKNPFKRFVRI